MKQSAGTNLTQETKLCFYWGLALGTIIGLALAFQNAYFSNSYLQKDLTNVALEIFFGRLILSVIGVTIVLLILLPAINFLSRSVSAIVDIRLARLATVIGGVVLISGGYLINKSTWFPPIFSMSGIIANSVLGIICLILTIGLYKSFLGFQLELPRPGFGLMTRLYHRLLFGILVVSFLGFNTYAYIQLSSQKPSGPNLLFITIDTLRADRLGVYGYERDTSPTIDKLAQDGLVFSNAFAQRGLTWPSLTSIMTSLYPKTHGVLSNQIPLDGQFTTLAELLKNAGYKTGAFLANFYHAPNRGFDVKKGGEVGNLDKSITRDALSWMDKIDPEDDRFFMWIHYKNPHDPYVPPEPFSSFFDSTYTGAFDGSRPVLDSIYVNKVDLPDRDLDHLNALYDAEIRSSDSYIERILERLEEKGLADNTLIVFSADHGEEMYDHNYYFFHSCSMYDGTLHIPLILKFPNVIPAGDVVKNQVESIDIMPTILDFMKLPLLEEFEGHSLLPVIFGQVNGAWRPAFAQRASSIFSIRTPEWKYIYNPDNYHTYCSRSEDDDGEGFIIAGEELYHLPSDPKETNNVVTEHPELVIELRAQIIEWINTNKREHKEYKLTKDAEERLRALGYIK